MLQSWCTLHGCQYVPYVQHASHGDTVMEEMVVAHAWPAMMSTVSAPQLTVVKHNVKPSDVKSNIHDWDHRQSQRAT